MGWKNILKRQTSLGEFSDELKKPKEKPIEKPKEKPTESKQPSREEMIRALYEDYLDYVETWGERYFPMFVDDMSETEEYYYEEFKSMLERFRKLDPVKDWDKLDVDEEFHDAGLRNPVDIGDNDKIIEEYNELQSRLDY